MSENLAFPIPNTVLEPYIKTAVSTAIVAALGDGSELVAQAVHAALSTKVNADGKVDANYSSYNKYQLVEVLARKKIAEVARETINEMAEQMRPKIRMEIERQLRDKHGLIAQTLVDGLIESLTAKWSVHITMASS